jgi:hypothetical protein
MASMVRPQSALAVVHVPTCENDKKEEKYYNWFHEFVHPTLLRTGHNGAETGCVCMLRKAVGSNRRSYSVSLRHPFHLRLVADTAFETLCFLELEDKVQ